MTAPVAIRPAIAPISRTATTLPTALRSRIHAASVLPIYRTPILFIAANSIASIVPTLGSILQDLWEGVLRAVPKKKTTHSKARSRRLAGKALKDLTSLNTCSSCGRVKRMHILCPHCVQNIKDMWANRLKKITSTTGIGKG